jgi:osmoprotectant transport system ATP-binding protein
MIRLEQVTKRYDDTTAVDGLTFEVPEGEVCVLIGPSGCGKTTTLRMINRLIEPTSGRIFVGEKDILSVTPEELRRGLGYAIQSVGLFPHLTVADNIMTVPKLLKWDRKRMRERVEELLALVGLPPEEYAGKYPRQLSGGEAQRIGVARALAADPPVLLMDEPFGAVDPLNRERLQTEFARIQRSLRKTVIFVTHDVDEAIRLADHIALMREGRLQQYATPEEILDHPANKFVHDFMGADRALKRLGRVRVSEAMRTGVPSIAGGRTPEALAERAACADTRFVYLTDAEGRLEGWFDCQAVARGASTEDAVTLVDWREDAVRPDTSLKEALSRMLGHGFRSIAVTDLAGRLVGDVAFSAVEAAMSDSDERMAAAGAGSGSEDGAPAPDQGGALE